MKSHICGRSPFFFTFFLEICIFQLFSGDFPLGGFSCDPFMCQKSHIFSKFFLPRQWGVWYLPDFPSFEKFCFLTSWVPKFSPSSLFLYGKPPYTRFSQEPLIRLIFASVERWLIQKCNSGRFRAVKIFRIQVTCHTCGATGGGCCFLFLLLFCLTQETQAKSVYAE